MADVSLSGLNPKVDFEDDDDSTYFHFDCNFDELRFMFGSSTQCGRIESDVYASLDSAVVLEDASTTTLELSHASDDDFRIQSTSSGQLLVRADTGSWVDVLMLTGGAIPAIELKGDITNLSSGGASIVFEKNTGTGDIIDFYSNTVRRAYIHGDGLVDLSAGALRLQDAGTLPSPSVSVFRNIYFADDASNPQIAIVGLGGSGYILLQANLVAV